ncbi:hypothetical protein BD311DRAFT_686791 [Dichomitus squalens]|uniref:Small RNA 2'-O-methyltransferase n=1 Tax=Dichomitus squalens TaxID=114155 RepID=A0A4Q9MX13_9APHY|nr:hypothetical protein BD311DRAFT_686791 [Dichomitus squalens]
MSFPDTIMSSRGSEVSELAVTFHPALYLQRRGWVLDIMRREGVTEILDIGCGEGELLSCLCNPALWLAPPPPDVLPPATDASPAETDVLKELHEWVLHPTRIAGLDICKSELECAARVTKPPEPDRDDVPWHSTPVRWEPLEVKIWEGSLEHVNAEYAGVECIVATEVIEHLPEHVLDRFAPVVFGAYHPRLVILTTPSFTFNARFTAPDAPYEARSGWRDPTGRTDRIFRHHDHKFEWTVEEFERWCQSVAGEWGYTVEIDGVGKAQEKDEWGRDDALGWATQCAAFTRIEGEDWVTKRAALWEASDGLHARTSSPGTHSLFASHRFAANDASRSPKPLDVVGELVLSKMLYYRQTSIALNEIWFEREVELACGGWIDWLVRAIQEHPGLALRRTVLASRIDPHWTIELDPALHHLVPPPAIREDIWPSPPDTEELTDLEEAVDMIGSRQDGSVLVKDADLETYEEGWGAESEDANTGWGNVQIDWGWGKAGGDGDRMPDSGAPEASGGETWTWG